MHAKFDLYYKHLKNLNTTIKGFNNTKTIVTAILGQQSMKGDVHYILFPTDFLIILNTNSVFLTTIFDRKRPFYFSGKFIVIIKISRIEKLRIKNCFYFLRYDSGSFYDLFENLLRIKSCDSTESAIQTDYKFNLAEFCKDLLKIYNKQES